MNTKAKIQSVAQAGVALQDAASERIDGLQSKILNWLGCLLFGRPESLGLPADFYYSRFDRAMPDPKEGDDWKQLRMRVYVNRVRIGMIRRLMKWLLIVNIAVIVLTIPLYFLGSMVAASRFFAPEPAASQGSSYTMPNYLGAGRR